MGPNTSLGCGICLGEAELGWRLTQQGATDAAHIQAAIVARVDVHSWYRARGDTGLLIEGEGLTMELGTLLLIALLLVCPLTMFWLMRYGHRGHEDGSAPPSQKPMTPEGGASGSKESDDPSQDPGDDRRHP